MAKVYILGVNNRSSSIAVLAETGQYPLTFDICRCLAKYWARMRNLDTKSLLYNAFEENKLMVKDNCSCWLGNFEKILRSSEMYVDESGTCIDIHDIGEDDKTAGEMVYDRLKEMYDNQFTMDLGSDITHNIEGNKLRTYRKFKTNIAEEKYLTYVKSFDLRKNICRLRISSHNLPIETGRHRRPEKIPANLRFCTDCNLNLIGDEYHIIMICKKFHREREDYFDKINSTYIGFNNLETDEKFKIIMEMENERVVDNTLSFIRKIIKSRGNF